MSDQPEMQKILLAARPGKGRWIWGLLACGAGVLVAFWLFSGSDSPQISYETAPASRATLTVIVTATGTVQPTTEVDVSSELSGTLAEVAVDYNDRVEVGQMLARLDSRKMEAQVANAEAALARARAQVTQAEATVRQADAELTRARALDRRGITSQSNLETAEAEDDRARAALESARADLTLAMANLALEEADLDKAQIRSPIRGIVLERTAEPGQIVASSLNAPVLFTLAEDLSRMELQVDIDEADIGQVSVGDPALFTVEAWRGQSFPARIIQLRYAPEETDGVVTYKAVLSVDNSNGKLRPGMTATAEITVETVTDALTVPNAALRYAPPPVATPTESSGGGLIGLLIPDRPNSDSGLATGRSVWVLRDGAPVEVAVTVGASDGTRTEIRDSTLAAGDAVIIDQRTGE